MPEYLVHKRFFLFFSVGYLVCIWSFPCSPLLQEVRKDNTAYPQVEIKDTELRTLKSKFVGQDESQRMRDGSIRLHDTLLKRGYPHLRFQFSLVEGENHRSLFPFAFSRGLRFVFSENNP